MTIPKLETLKQVVVEAATIINREFGKPISSTMKQDDTPVSRIDHAINAFLMDWAHTNGLSFLGEEGNGNETGQVFLFVDPLDGTGAFLRGIATATTIASILYVKNGRGLPLMSVIHNPLTHETWTSALGEPTMYQRGNTKPRKVKVSKAKTGWKTALCAWPGVDQRFADFQNRTIAHPKFSDQQMGAFGIGGGLIASGLIHATAITATSAVESVAMSLIVRGAGGIATDLLGSPLECFELGMHKSKLDFLLPHGALFASTEKVSESLLSLY